jgi:hypothetical protein
LAYLRKKGSKVFLSYAHDDREIALKIAVRLRAAGFVAWDPELEILPGANWAAELSAALESAGAMVVLISPQAMASRTVSHQIEYALGAKHLDGHLIPVFVRPTKDAPWILNALPSVEYKDPVKTTNRIIELLGQTSDVPQANRWAS